MSAQPMDMFGFDKRELIARGFDEDLVEQAYLAGDLSIWAALQDLGPGQVETFNDVWRSRDPAPGSWSLSVLPGPRCRLLCCPALPPHDRTHPLCLAMPQLWDGDQA